MSPRLGWMVSGAIVLIVGAWLILAAPAEVRAEPEFLGEFNARYGTAGTRLDSCALCHTSLPRRNQYGTDWEEEDEEYAAIEHLDSDGDGWTNLEEIQALSFPGDANDRPTSGSTTTTNPTTTTTSPGTTTTTSPGTTTTSPGTTTTTTSPGTTTTTVPGGGADGAAIYATECAACHGATGEGGFGGPVAGTALSRSQVIAITTDGTSGMPGFGGRLSGGQIGAVADHVLSLGGLATTTTTSTTLPLLDGQLLYAENCASCHGAVGGGGFGGPLNGAALGRSAVIAITTSGTSGMPAFEGRLSGDQIGAIADHVLTFVVPSTTTTTLPLGADGAAIYAASCAGCHGAAGEGGPGGALDGPTLTHGGVVSITTNGGNGMPGFAGQLTPQQISAVANHVLTLVIGPTTTTTLPAGADGATVFAGHCASCHGTSGEGGFGGPVAGTSLDRASIIAITAAGTTGMPAFSNKLSADQIGAVADHILSLSGAGIPAPTPSAGSAGSPGASAAGLFATHCAGCHGPRGEGGPGGSLLASSLSRSRQVAVTINGSGAMPAFAGKLSRAQVEAMIRWVHGAGSAGGNGSTPGEPIDRPATGTDEPLTAGDGQPATPQPEAAGGEPALAGAALESDEPTSGIGLTLLATMVLLASAGAAVGNGLPLEKELDTATE